MGDTMVKIVSRSTNYPLSNRIPLLEVGNPVARMVPFKNAFHDDTNPAALAEALDFLAQEACSAVWEVMTMTRSVSYRPGRGTTE